MSVRSRRTLETSAIEAVVSAITHRLIRARVGRTAFWFRIVPDFCAFANILPFDGKEFHIAALLFYALGALVPRWAQGLPFTRQRKYAIGLHSFRHCVIPKVHRHGARRLGWAICPGVHARCSNAAFTKLAGNTCRLLASSAPVPIRTRGRPRPHRHRNICWGRIVGCGDL